MGPGPGLGALGLGPQSPARGPDRDQEHVRRVEVLVKQTVLVQLQKPRAELLAENIVVSDVSFRGVCTIERWCGGGICRAKTIVGGGSPPSEAAGNDCTTRTPSNDCAACTPEHAERFQSAFGRRNRQRVSRKRASTRLKTIPSVPIEFR